MKYNLSFIVIGLFLLVGCGKTRGPIHYVIIDYLSYPDMVADWDYQNNYIDEGVTVSFPFTLDGFITSYHCSGLDYTDSIVASSDSNMPNGKTILANRDCFSLNKDGDKSLYVTYPYLKQNVELQSNDLYWEILGEKNSTGSFYTENKLSTERIPVICGSPLDEIDYLYALTNDEHTRFLYVFSSQNMIDEFLDKYQSILISYFLEALNID